MTEKSNQSVSVASETYIVAWAALVLALVCLSYCFRHGLLLLYGDAVAHLYIARRIFDSRNPGFRQLGSVWLPLPHILLLPFVQISVWWQDGLAGAWVSIPSYVLGCAGLYRLSRMWLSIPLALLAVSFYALNPGLLYMSATAMTEPLFLAEVIWATLLIVLFDRGLEASTSNRVKKPAGADRQLSPRRLLIYAGLVLVGAIFTRYDGWIFAAAAWLFITLRLAARPHARKPVLKAWMLFTAMMIAAPAAWLAYNAAVFGDPLDFIRGPFSARAIEIRTSLPGKPNHPGTGSMHVAALYFLKAAEMGAIPLRYGNKLFWFTVAGTLAALVRFRRKAIWPALLLWLPLPFYSYAIAYGSVPIFIPQWWPFSWYNTRYGMEMLPAFAFFGACFIAVLLELAPKWEHRNLEQWIAPVIALLIMLNSVVLLRSKPLVFQEARANSRTRIPFESALAKALLNLPPAGTILMYTSQDAGAVQQSGIPLRRFLSEGDFHEWGHALEDPARAAMAVVAMDRDPVAQAVQKHPQGLQLINVICSTGQPCTRIYRSELYTPRFPSLSPGRGN